MMARHLLAATLFALCTQAGAADTYTLDERHVFPVFEVNHFGFSTQRGRFNKASGKVVLDLSGHSGSVEASVDTQSIDMGLDEWDRMMKSDVFFNTAKYPAMRFVSDKLVFEGDRLVAAEGRFTLLGETRPLRLSIANFKCALHPVTHQQTCSGDITATLRRSDFGMKSLLPMVGDEILIRIPVEAIKLE